MSEEHDMSQEPDLDVAVALTSTQKLAYLAEQLETYPGDGQLAMLLEVGRMALPAIREMIPEDPVELDAMLDQVVEFLGQLKSDPAALGAPAS